MPGLPFPQILVMDKTFPPSRTTVSALLDSGWFFEYAHPHDPRVSRFCKNFEGTDYPFNIMNSYLIAEDNRMAITAQNS